MGSIEDKIKKNIEHFDAWVSDRDFLSKVEAQMAEDKSFSLPFSLIEAQSEAKIRKISFFYAEKLILSRFEDLEQLLGNKTFISNLVSQSEAFDFFYDFLSQQFKSLSSRSLQKRILNIKKPLLNYRLEHFIKVSLKKSTKEKIEDKDLQILCLSAFLHPLRQTVGSCFATAPAIQIQREQPELFFRDMIELLNIGQLKRVNEAIEQTIPMSFAFSSYRFKQKFCIQSIKEWMSSLEGKSIADFQEWYLGCTCEEEKERIAEKKLHRLKFNHPVSLEEICILLTTSAHPASNTKKLLIMSDHWQAKNLPQIERNETKELPSFINLKHFVYQIYDNLLLKSWEYTLASFSESKLGFYKWNLYTSLGLRPEDKGGLAEAIFEYLEKAIEEGKNRVEQFHREYEEEFYQVKFLESRLKNAETSQMEAWARMEYQNHVHEMNRLLNARESEAEWIERVTQILPTFIQALDRLFPKYFQELYDAEMQDLSNFFYEDAPAGFRLIYKHGRADPSLWTSIQNEEEYIGAIRDFFLLVENELKSLEAFKGLSQVISEIITTIVATLQTKTFLESAYERVCKRYHSPYHQEYKKSDLPFKPWSYLSGGTLEGLLHCYLQRKRDFSITKRNLATPLELCSFLIDTARELTPSLYREFLSQPSKSLFISSPNHAFLFQPGLMPLKEIWEDKNHYSYSWIRDNWVINSQNWIHEIEVKPNEAQLFIQTYLGDYPYCAQWFRNRIFWPNYSLSLTDFKKLCCQPLDSIPEQFLSMNLSEERIEGWIYEFFPYISNDSLFKKIQEVVALLQVKERDKEQIESFLNALLEKRHKEAGLSSLQFFQLMKSALVLDSIDENFKRESSLVILKAMRLAKVCMPSPLYFADSNWPYYHLAFFLDLETLQLSLWRFEKWGRRGFPMRTWDRFFDEANPSKWTIYTNPNEFIFDLVPNR